MGQYLKILQVNVGRSRAATDLAIWTSKEKQVDITVLVEPNIRAVQTPVWSRDLKTDVAVRIWNNGFDQPTVKSGDGYASLAFEGFRVVGCYISPNLTREGYDQKATGIMDAVLVKPRRVILLGDLNAKSATWGSPLTDRRGHLWETLFATAGMCPINRGQKPTFVRGASETYIDVTAVTNDLLPKVVSWDVLEEDSMSYHQYILFELKVSSCRHAKFGRVVKMVDWEVFDEEVALRLRWNDGEASWRACLEAIGGAYRSATTHDTTDGRRPYWWTQEIAEARCVANGARRKMQRLRGRGGGEAELAQATHDHKEKRRSLARLISASKKANWKKLLVDLNRDPWGLGYKIVAKFAGTTKPVRLETRKEARILKDLFPRIACRAEANERILQEPPPFTASELKSAVSHLRNNKAPGQDKIPSEALKRVHNAHPDYLLEVYNRLARENVFPEEWKRATVVLLPKPGKDPECSDAYRPISLLSASSKLYEHLLRTRLMDELVEERALATNQFGFVRGKSTVDALAHVTKIRADNSVPWLVLVTLDVKNAFNSARWDLIKRELREKILPVYLQNILDSYLEDRTIRTRKNKIRMEAGVPQGSVLGPLLWNLLYDKILRLVLMGRAWLVGFADDLALLVAAADLMELIHFLNVNLFILKKWLNEKSLKLAEAKTEAVVLRGGRKWRDIKFSIGSFEVVPSKTIKYLGVLFGNGGHMGAHIVEACRRADVKANQVTRIMPNMDGPSSEKRKTIATVHASTILYAAPIWSDYMEVEYYRSMVERSQRKVLLRVASAYRTVSAKAIQVITGTVPMYLQALERAEVYRGGAGPQCREAAREKTLDKWNREWEEETSVASWTRRLIKDLKSWVKCGHRRVGYFLTQALTGHGSFRFFLCGIGRDSTENCMYCDEVDTPEHTLFHCTRWETRRRTAETSLGVHPTVDNTIDLMIESTDNWTILEEMLVSIMKRKEIEERTRQTMHGR